MPLGHLLCTLTEQPLKPAFAVFPHYRCPTGTLQSLTIRNCVTTPTHCACAGGQLREAPVRTCRPSRLGWGVLTRRSCAEGRRHAASLLWKRVAVICSGSICCLSAGWKRAPSSVGPVMALQLSREQGIAPRGCAKIVAEFFCKCSSRRPEGGEN